MFAFTLRRFPAYPKPGREKSNPSLSHRNFPSCQRPSWRRPDPVGTPQRGKKKMCIQSLLQYILSK
jgi:hypothetical protein